MIRTLLIVCLLIVADYCLGDNSNTKVQDSIKFTNDSYVLEFDSNKGLLELCFYSPCFNMFQINADDYGIQSGSGFGGLAASLDYYHSDFQFLSLSINGILTHDSPLFLLNTGGVQAGINQMFRSTYLGLTNNHVIDDFIIGYGFSFSKENWFWQELDNGFNIETKEENRKSIGLMFPVSVMLGKSFFIGVTYRPTFIQFSPKSRINYEYLLSYNFGWRYSKNKK